MSVCLGRSESRHLRRYVDPAWKQTRIWSRRTAALLVEAEEPLDVELAAALVRGFFDQRSTMATRVAEVPADRPGRAAA